MPKFYNADFVRLPVKNFRLENASTDPTFVSGDKGLMWIDTNGVIRFNGGDANWALRDTGHKIVTGDFDTGTIAPAVITGTAVVTGDSRLSDSRVPTGSAGGKLSGTYPNPGIAAQAITATEIANALKPSQGAATTVESLRALGTAAGTAAAGNDSRFGAASPPNGAAGGDLAGTYPNPTIRTTLNDPAAGTVGLRSLGTGAQQAAAGNHNHTASSLTNFGTDVNAAVTEARVRALIATLAGDLSVNTRKITNLVDPTNAQDAATKAYVDGAIQGLQLKRSVKLASTSNINLSSPSNSFDGQTLASGDAPTRVLIRAQSNPNENGIYNWNGSSVAMTRATDADAAGELTQAFTFVEEGGTLSDTGWVSAGSTGPIGSFPITWIQFSTAGQIEAGAGLAKSGNTIELAYEGVTGYHVASSLAGNGLTKTPGAAGPISLAVGGVSGRHLALNVFSSSTASDGTDSRVGQGLGWANEEGGDGFLPSVMVDGTIGFSAAPGTDVRGRNYRAIGVKWGAITNNHLANFAATTNKIADEAVTNAKLGPLAVTSGKIADGAIDFGSAKVAGINSVAKGGTGADNASTARLNLGTVGYYTESGPTSGSATWTISRSTNHMLRASRNLFVQVQSTATGEIVYPDINVASNGDVTINFGFAVSGSSQYTCTIIG